MAQVLEWSKFNFDGFSLGRFYSILFYSKARRCGLLNLNGTLDENGLHDEEACDIELPPPSIWLYYTDDLTIA